MFRISFSLFIIIFSLNYKANAQYGYYSDVLKFSHYFNNGSSRIQGIGGASSSLGGDISSILLNPAGLGFFNKKIFSISYKSFYQDNSAIYLDKSSLSNFSKDKIENLSLLLTVRNKDNYLNDIIDCKNCPKINVGFSYGVVKDFSNDKTYGAYNNHNSIIDYLLIDAQGVPFSQISNSQPIAGIGLLQEAYDHYLINPDQDLPGAYFSFVGGFPFQMERIINNGSISKFSISSGLNFSDKFYLGFGSNTYFINYEETRIFTENNYEILNENNQWEIEGILDFLIITDNFKITGNGSSFTFGFIFKPIDNLNFGLNYESKTKYLLNEELSNELETSYLNYYFAPEDTVLSSSKSETAKNVAEYRFSSPSKLTLGTSYFFKKFGFISADVDFVNYSSANISSFDFATYNDNREIKNIYKSLAINYRVGIEGRLKKFYLRAGYSFLADPNRISLGNKYEFIKKSLGIGYLSNNINLDLTYTTQQRAESILPYKVFSYQPIAEILTKNNQIILTIGVRINQR